MDRFNYREGVLHGEDVDLNALAAQLGTPLFVYSLGTLAAHFQSLKDAFSPIDPLICYSVKSCSNLHILKFLVQQGAGIDVVSGGEIYRALLAGAAPDTIVFAGVGKSAEEIRYAVESGIHLFNVESQGELERIDAIAGECGRRVKVSIRINPDVADAATPQKTSTGGRQTKFGIPVSQAPVLFVPGRYMHLTVEGVHVHLGSPIHDTGTYLAAIEVIEGLLERVAALGGRVDTLNIGGGFPATYAGGQDAQGALQAMGAAICARLRGLKARGVRFVIEPGRSISANAGVLLTRVEYIKQGWDRRIVIVDAGMNVLLRPTLYGAHHTIWPVSHTDFSGHWSVAAQAPSETVDVVGPICETGDYLALARDLPVVDQGALLAVFSAGAYAMSMASQYNSRPRPAEVVVQGKAHRVVRRREGYADLVEAEEGC
ncbi:diaminopimelate decarboxylase [Pseudomonas sp. MAFF212428]|uniref:Diaminopimelate decarboxylase n=1 Tax=Pseudomonas brassicae TaxID=2708063 RepID=A0A6M0CS19_9PSED|nr:diaminopimelate decarboxylase [Pseudomonas brassicae]